ncbi:bifunctional adenosylcobinamide kinase/adenosylcobinamide-phosphate guanylyltransferase [Actinospica sp.]|uniref:bifunctional adenosylcobinamide kinase/adenosylcobinamide-phosphate guanylyltransferase n=1 Tax=Actinospica sp. TaxID=1872142 RepID=UPI002D0B9236|nr:bifunctional adenosylcobinamide kinase/adenosylcobinamide-phosphate guanylyltransferase [Actinospica sp.]HWG24564.1 bifunctional adenosylcobinamide kinase/adenosylcobinamide-phosphate guanylyltransferase [Actinospica sp.]
MDTRQAARRTLILGGARSGKSTFAERMLAETADQRTVTYAATAPRYPGDPEWAERIARHQAQRPGGWRTVETGDEPAALAELFRSAEGPVLADCLTLWLTSAMDTVSAWDEGIWASGSAPRELGELTRGLIAAYESCPGPVVAVSNELGFGLVPPDPGTRRFRDELGRLNQAFAAAADAVWLVVAGLPLRLK